MKRNVLLTIAYDGSGFHGWQRQPGERTVQGHLEQVMSRLFNREILLSGTSRTDAGVHALDQHATFTADIGIPVEKIALVVNNALCAAEGSESGRGGFAKAPVRILKAEEMPPEFHARFDCKGKEYIYRICAGTAGMAGTAADTAGIAGTVADTAGIAGTVADTAGMAAQQICDMSLIFERNYVYHVKERLDVRAMNEAAAFIVGEHDFKSFEASGGNPRETTVRTMSAAYVAEASTDSAATIPAYSTTQSLQKIEFHVAGDGFLYNMVRIMTGTLVEIGQGKRRPEEIKDIIDSRDRTRAGHTAPPNGLYLAKVYY